MHVARLWGKPKTSSAPFFPLHLSGVTKHKQQKADGELAIQLVMGTLMRTFPLSSLVAPCLMTFSSVIPGFLMTAMGQYTSSCGIPTRRMLHLAFCRCWIDLNSVEINKTFRPISHGDCEGRLQFSSLIADMICYALSCWQ